MQHFFFPFLLVILHFSFFFALAFAHPVYVICTVRLWYHWLSLKPEKQERFLLKTATDFTYLWFKLNEISCHCEQCLNTVHSALFGSDCMWGKSLVLREAHDGLTESYELPNFIRTNCFFFWFFELSTAGVGRCQGSFWVCSIYVCEWTLFLLDFLDSEQGLNVPPLLKPSVLYMKKGPYLNSNILKYICNMNILCLKNIRSD